jgi:hypothetical protein
VETAQAYQGSRERPNTVELTYSCSNPPASGDHYGTWGTWGVHMKPLQRGHYVDNLEQGGVVLLYNCPSGCPDVVAQLQAVADAQPRDPTCSDTIGRRIVITPDPLLDHTVAAAAWLYTYEADCVDSTSLASFIARHYGMGPQSSCVQGATF